MLWSTPEVKQLNKEKIRKEIQNGGECTKASIARQTSLSIVTCNTLLNEMLEDNEILEVSEDEKYSGRPGRPASIFTYNRDYLHVLGIALSHEDNKVKVLSVITDAFGEILEKNASFEEVVDYNYIETYVGEILDKDPLVKGISIGIPGVIDDGTIENCDIEELNGVELKKNLKKLNVKVEVRNDMDFITYGLYSKLNMGDGSLASIYFPPGDDCAGAGFIINGNIVNGFSQYSGELSYIAAAFGISREEQKKLAKGDREDFTKLVSKMVMIAIGTIDPEKIILMGNGINNKELMAVWQDCSDVVSEKHVPDISIDNDIEGNYVNGLARITLNKLQFPILMML